MRDSLFGATGATEGDTAQISQGGTAQSGTQGDIERDTKIGTEQSMSLIRYSKPFLSSHLSSTARHPVETNHNLKFGYDVTQGIASFQAGGKADTTATLWIAKLVDETTGRVKTDIELKVAFDAKSTIDDYLQLSLMRRVDPTLQEFPPSRMWGIMEEPTKFDPVEKSYTVRSSPCVVCPITGGAYSVHILQQQHPGTHVQIFVSDSYTEYKTVCNVTLIVPSSSSPAGKALTLSVLTPLASNIQSNFHLEYLFGFFTISADCSFNNSVLKLLLLVFLNISVSSIGLF